MPVHTGHGIILRKIPFPTPAARTHAGARAAPDINAANDPIASLHFHRKTGFITPMLIYGSCTNLLASLTEAASGI